MQAIEHRQPTSNNQGRNGTDETRTDAGYLTQCWLTAFFKDVDHLGSEAAQVCRGFLIGVNPVRVRALSA
jgi:hypothetical protein